MKNKYDVVVPFSGYSRGTISYRVEASSKEEALNLVRDGEGEMYSRDIHRDDTERYMEYADVYEVKA